MKKLSLNLSWQVFLRIVLGFSVLATRTEENTDKNYTCCQMII